MQYEIQRRFKQVHYLKRQQQSFIKIVMAMGMEMQASHRQHVRCQEDILQTVQTVLIPTQESIQQQSGTAMMMRMDSVMV